jgi:muramidase (phage lysozyme)
MDKRFSLTSKVFLLGCVILLSGLNQSCTPSRRSIAKNPFFQTVNTPPLVMKDGDPYVRALMRTISASEANSRRPYSILYGGSHVQDLSRHPDRCIRIVNGPNKNNCSTAAGRYQMINTTWAHTAEKYHPQKECFAFFFNCTYSFEPEYQDRVVYSWLSDEGAWGMNIPQLLKDGQLDPVRRRLSSTWTSLGYGIENNAITPRLPAIYQKVLKEELQRG